MHVTSCDSSPSEMELVIVADGSLFQAVYFYRQVRIFRARNCIERCRSRRKHDEDVVVHILRRMKYKQVIIFISGQEMLDVYRGLESSRITHRQRATVHFLPVLDDVSQCSVGFRVRQHSTRRRRMFDRIFCDWFLMQEHAYSRHRRRRGGGNHMRRRPTRGSKGRCGSGIPATRRHDQCTYDCDTTSSHWGFLGGLSVHCDAVCGHEVLVACRRVCIGIHDIVFVAVCGARSSTRTQRS